MTRCGLSGFLNRIINAVHHRLDSNRSQWKGLAGRFQAHLAIEDVSVQFRQERGSDESCEKAGFARMAELKDFPLGHTNTIFCKILKT